MVLAWRLERELHEAPKLEDASDSYVRNGVPVFVEQRQGMSLMSEGAIVRPKTRVDDVIRYVNDITAKLVIYSRRHILGSEDALIRLVQDFIALRHTLGESE